MLLLLDDGGVTTGGVDCVVDDDLTVEVITCLSHVLL